MADQSQRLKEIENNIARLWAYVKGLRQRMSGDFDLLRELKFYPLSAPVTHTSFDGDAFSSAGPTKIENTSWSSTIPAEATALLIRVLARDSGASLQTALYFSVGPSATYWDAGGVWPIGDDVWDENMIVVPCTDGDIYYKCGTSGTDTMDVHLLVWGYWL